MIRNISGETIFSLFGSRDFSRNYGYFGIY